MQDARLVKLHSELEAATSAAVAAWHRQMVRRQVQQSTWDPSSNSSRRVSGMRATG